VTSSIAAETATRKRGRGSPRTRATMVDGLLNAISLEADAADTSRVRLPSSYYRTDPARFCREILGLEPWSRQVEILEAIRDHDRVAVKSGHKVGKSNIAASAALWFYSSFPDARVVMTSTTSRQVDQILWRELRMLRARGGRCVDCLAADPDGLRIPRPCPHSALIDGEQGELARTGLKANDFREIVGFTAREAEAVAGISGSRLLYIVDEASGVDDLIFEAIEGNRAGGAKILELGNPTKNEGEFYEAEASKSRFYKVIHVSSEESPNVVAGQVVIPGLATREWIEEKREEWGKDSPLYRVRVLGQHAIHEQGKIFSIHTIEQAEQRWDETPATGRLFVGLDPAGETGSGDETVFAPRRGFKLLALQAHLGLDDEAHLVHLLGVLKAHKLPRETPVVVLDREGSIGSKLARRLRDYLDTPEGANAFELVTVRASDRAVRQPQVYDRLRDELAANLETWLRDGGAIVEDTRLAKELHALEWRSMPNGRVKLTAKEEIRKAIGRSPDRYDGLALAVWEPLSLQDDVPDSVQHVARASAPPRASAAEADDGDELLDPYDAADAFSGRPRR
jgi:phage terminase large subunit